MRQCHNVNNVNNKSLRYQVSKVFLGLYIYCDEHHSEIDNDEWLRDKKVLSQNLSYNF